MTKRILAIAVIAGLGTAPLALGQTGPSAGGAEIRAEVGHYFGKWVIRKAKGRLDWAAGGVQAASEGGGAALGGLLGTLVAGPVGMVAGAAAGAA